MLLALAEELGEFVPLVGGAQYAHFLLQPLEALATVDETVVRECAVASICSITGQMPAGSVQEHLLPLLQVRMPAAPHDSSAVCCACASAVCSGISVWQPRIHLGRSMHACRDWRDGSGQRGFLRASCLPRRIRQLR